MDGQELDNLVQRASFFYCFFSSLLNQVLSESALPAVWTLLSDFQMIGDDNNEVF